MNYNEAIQAVELVLESQGVPLLIGESGIGKTALAKKISNKNHWYLITIDGNMLKEGEIGGLPAVEEYNVEIDGKVIKRRRTVYAVHTKLHEIDEVLFHEPEREILLFVDEINRCEHSVQQELMNIILNREINGYKLHEKVKVLAAMNPSSKYDAYQESDYQVVDMDPAQEDRFVWIELETDVKTWIAWGMEQHAGRQNIHEDILEFIANFPEFLHTPYSREMVKATPRSWERVSNTYKIYKEKRKNVSENVFMNVIAGNVGSSISQELYQFLEQRSKPLISEAEVFENEELSYELKQKVKAESHSRLYLTARNILNSLKRKEESKREIKLFSKFLQLYPSDLKLGIMKEVKENYHDSLYKEFLMEDTFVEGYFSLFLGSK